ncbi:MAG: hypothetical protein WA843_04690 [Candidatus Saccharimonadales bacterium]
MSEQLPPSIQHDFTVHESTNPNLLIAESRAYHSYTEHPHPPNPAVPQEDIIAKTRGVGYTETELGGKPFIVAERLTVYENSFTCS